MVDIFDNDNWLTLRRTKTQHKKKKACTGKIEEN